MIKELLDERTTGSYGLSVGTSIVMETLFGSDHLVYKKDRVIERMDYRPYSYMYINLYTIVRNILSSADKTTADLINKSSYRTILEVIYTEVEIIESLLHGSGVEPVWYMFDYSKGLIEIKNVSTKASKLFLLTKDVLEYDKDEFSAICTNYIRGGIKLTDCKDKRVIMNTHITQDLLNHKYTNTLVNVESVTGAVITKMNFNKKYPKSAAYDKKRLPFNEVILRMVGDGLLIRQAFKTKEFDSRKIVGRLADEFNWTPLTSEDTVIRNIRSDADGRDMYNAVKLKLIYK